MLFVAAACGDDDDDGTADGTATTATTSEGGSSGDAGEEVVGDTIVIGMHTSESDQVNFDDGAQVAIDAVNAGGGVNGRQVELIVESEGFLDPVRARSAARRLVEENDPFMLLGALGGDVIAAVTRVADEEEVPYIHGGADQESLADSAWSYAVTPTHPFLAERTARYIVDELDGQNKKVGYALLASAEYDRSAQVFEETMEELTGEKPVGVRVALGERDMAPHLLTLKGADLDIVYTILTAEGIILAGAGRAQDFAPTYVMNTACLDLLVGAAQGALDGARCLQISNTPTSPETAEFRAAWDEFGPDAEPNFQAMWGYSIADIALAALEAAGEDLTKEVLRTVLEDFEYSNGITSPVRFDGTPFGGDTATAIYQVNGTEIEILEPVG